MAKAASIALLSSVMACGGSSPGSVNGTVHGVSYTVKDAISATITTTNNTGTSHAGLIVMGSAAGLCNHAQSLSLPPNLAAIVIAVGVTNGALSSAPSAGGVFTICPSTGCGSSPPMLLATLNTSVTDSSCTTIANDTASATTGTVTLTSASGDTFDGHFDVTLDSGDHVTGEFSPEGCPALQSLLTLSTKPACM